MRMLDLFSGIGGFHKGFEQAGFTFSWVGYSEIDKYAAMVYQEKFPDAKALGDITAIQPGRDLPSNIDILCGGFPCQTFSIAGRRKGFDDTRGTLFFDIARILRHYRENGKPIHYFVLENVKGLLSHDNGRTFATIYRVLADLGYTVECQLLNTRWVLPQNRERIYIVGHLGNESKSKVFPIGESDSLLQKSRGPGQTKNQCATAITQNIMRGAHLGGETLIQVGNIDKKGHNSIWGRVYDTEGISATLNSHGGGMGAKTGLYRITEATKKGYAEAEEGDSINLSVPNSKTRRGRVGKGIAQTLDTGMQQYTIDNTSIRRLTPKECERLQGFPDDWTAYADGQKISDTQRYKMCGNAVSVPVVELVAKKIRSLHG
jgi:DNA (cytosine-5)-methyltransferase 1